MAIGGQFSHHLRRIFEEKKNISKINTTTTTLTKDRANQLHNYDETKHHTNRNPPSIALKKWADAKKIRKKNARLGKCIDDVWKEIIRQHSGGMLIMCTDATSSILSSAHRMNAENKCTTIQPWRKFSTYQVSAIIILFKYNHSNKKKKTLINVIISAHKIFINFIIILDMAEKKKILEI